MEYNVHYQATISTTPNSQAGVGQIEAPDDQRCNVPFQYRSGAPSEYEMMLCSSLSEVFIKGIETLPEIVKSLNHMNVGMPNGEPWTAEIFELEMARMGH
jgi:hypothetical protein